jgi:hypothetical protein
VNLIWKKSSFTGQENCVELAHLGAAVAVRDSKDPDGPVLWFPQLPSGPPWIVMATKIMQAPNPE